MAHSKKKHDYYSTYTKIFINDWPAFRIALAKHTSAIGSEGKKNLRDFALISDKELNSALSGPFAPVFEEFLNAYLIIKRANFEKRLQDDSVFTEAKENLPENPCNMKDREADIKLKHKEPPEEVIRITSSADTEKRLEQLDALFNTSFRTFAKLHQAAYNESIKKFTAINCTLSEQDKNFLNSDEPLDEIQRRFIDISLEIPKIKDGGLFFSYYLQLKLILCIHSTLSMQQLPHGNKDILEKLKQFKEITTTCEKHEEKMVTNQQTNVAGIIKAIKY
jgi:hypothetical protein